MPSSKPMLTSETRGRVRILRLNRPHKKNALNDALGWAIVAAIEQAAAEDDIWVIGLTGAGDAFCSGLDLTPAEDGSPASPLTAQAQQLDELGWVSRFPLAMREICDKPVVAGINGVAVGAGFSLAMAADVRLASSTARFLAGYARAGTSPDGGLSWTLPQAIGYERALRFLLEQKLASADEALALGIVGEVVPAEAFEQRFFEYCERLCRVSPIALRQTKRMLGRATAHADLAAHLRNEIACARRGLASEDGKEAMRAIIEKRAPVFRGR